MVYFFFLGQDAIEKQKQELASERSQYQSLLNQAKKEKQEVELEISQAGTDAYIENKARTQYGFLKPGEIRFEITNPEVLFEGMEPEALPTDEP
ncbi:MAG: septum formation initiator family protein [Clostridia bacterium]|nr:septum formation initiator family protein [Clostridia bacterium]